MSVVLVTSGLIFFFVGMTNGHWGDKGPGRPLTPDEKLGLVAGGLIFAAIGIGMAIAA